MPSVAVAPSCRISIADASQAPWLDGAFGESLTLSEAQLSAVRGQEQVAREQLNVVGGQEKVEVAPPSEWLAFQEVDLMAEFDMAEFNRMCGEYHRDVARLSSTTASTPSGTSDLELVQSDAGESLVSSKAQDPQVGQAQHDRQAQHDGQAQHNGQAQQVGQDPEGGVWSPPVGLVDFSQFLNENEVPEGCAGWEQFLNGQSGVEQSGSAK
ncbi:unnamed protein product [Zymoseptoria tritici ST99CH_1E4]|uniref:Uncharacterized protein n=1 Tax=Zymoseptoria tritici ST99CH_1E4 TaxID=1276532 RepID=A0A2H1H9Q6_ZYMTR|nr:unnamed protein product [Zymoseptoria tritici ST99CH_1E4]